MKLGSGRVLLFAMASSREPTRRNFTTLARGLDPASLPLADRLRDDIEATRRRYLEGQCELEEYKKCLDRFTRLVLDGEIPSDLDM
jgi:hypothetical protein